MRSTVTSLVAATAVVVALVFATPAFGGNPLDFTISPDSGPAGTTITVEGSCDDDVNEWDTVTIYLDAPSGAVIDEINESIVAGVPWAIEITIPESAEPGTYQVGKQCKRSTGGGGPTRRRPFTVTGEPTTTTTTTEVTTVPTDTEPADVVEAKPSVAVTATPSYTG